MKYLIICLISFLAIINVVSAQDDAQTAKDYFAKAGEYNSKMLVDSALKYYLLSSDIYQKNEQWSNYLICEYYCAQIYLFQGKLETAKKTFQTIESISLEKINNSNAILAAAYSGLGEIAFVSANSGLAIEYFDKAFNIQQKIKGENSIEVANLYNSFGNVYSQMGEHEMAFENYNKSIDIRTKINGINDPEIIKTLTNIAVIHNNKGEYDKALEIRINILDRSIKNKGENNIEVATIYGGIGIIYKNKQEYNFAKEYLLKSLTIKENILGSTHFKLAEDLINMGIICKELDEIDNANDYYFRALNIQKANFGETHPDLALTYNNLGLIANQQENYAKATEYFKNAITILKNHYGEFYPGIANIYSNIGIMHNQKEEWEQALINLEKSISINESIFGDKHPNLVEPYMNIANIYFSTKDDENALKYFQNSIISNVKNFAPKNYFENPKLENYYDANKLLEALQGKAKTLNSKYVADKQIIYLETAFQIFLLTDSLIDKIRKTTTTKADKIGLTAKVNKIYAMAIETCLKLDDANSNDNFYKNYAFYFSEKNKAGNLLEAIAGAQAKKFAGIPETLLDQEKYLSQQIAYYEKQLAQLENVENEPVFRNQLFISNTKYAELIKSLEINYPKYYEMKYSNKTASVTDIQEVLEPKQALRSYFLTDNNIYIFTITKKNINIEYVVINEDFNTLFEQFTTNITSGKTSNIKMYQQLANKIYSYLFVEEIDKSIEKLIIIPDGIINTIPFEALLTEAYTGELKNYKNYPFLLKKYSIAYSYSANLFYLTCKQKTERPAKDWIGIAPVFSEDNQFLIQGTPLTALPGSETEITEINNKFIEKSKVSEILLKKSASESKIKLLKLEEYKFIHMATHGFVNAEQPELSGIFLSRDTKTGDDGILYNGEIYNLKINSDLVILSACETGLGKISKGEGVIGLSRAFLYAGTKNIIVSLWQVSDASTNLLMQNFYANYLKTNANTDEISNFDEYLHNAKLNLISETEYGHPYFWSAFILIGK